MLTESKAPGKTKQNDLFALDVNRMAHNHLIYIIYESCVAKLVGVRDPNVVKVFQNVLANFALKHVLGDAVPLYESGFFGPGSSQLLETAYKQNLVDLRPQVIALAELSPEGGVPTTIGNEYGDIYENQFEVARASRMNKGHVPKYYQTHIKPLMNMVPMPKL